MNKFFIPLIALFFIIIFIVIILSSNSTKIISSQNEIEVIKDESNLDIIVNLGNFSKDNYSESMLLDIAMQYATKLNLSNELKTDDNYIQYVNKDDLHNIILELTGIVVEAPIIIDDFYYLYDSENSYYYYLGVSPQYYNISKINQIERTKNNYKINCSIHKNIDGEFFNIEDVVIILNFKPNQNIIKYQLEQIIINN